MNRRNLLTLLGAAPLLGVTKASAQMRQSNPRFQEISSRERIRQRYFPNLVLTNQLGEKVRLYDDLIKDKIVIFNMMYAKCEGICVPVTRNLVKVQSLIGDRMGKDIFMYSFTLKPEEDTPEHLAHYAHMHKIGPGWSLLTGTSADMESIRRKLGFTDPDPEADKDKKNHIGVIKYGNEALERWGGCPGMSKPAWIVKTVSWVDWPKQNGGAK
ncbi:MAG TPA: SCO family protein [Pyrinomonadaceae bacterium]|nr:SCO family protein [Pyrinomonadaceae bacterium]